MVTLPVTSAPAYPGHRAESSARDRRREHGGQRGSMNFKASPAIPDLVPPGTGQRADRERFAASRAAAQRGRRPVRGGRLPRERQAPVTPTAPTTSGRRSATRPGKFAGGLHGRARASTRSTSCRPTRRRTRSAPTCWSSSVATTTPCRTSSPAPSRHRRPARPSGRGQHADDRAPDVDHDEHRAEGGDRRHALRPRRPQDRRPAGRLPELMQQLSARAFLRRVSGRVRSSSLLVDHASRSAARTGSRRKKVAQVPKVAIDPALLRSGRQLPADRLRLARVRRQLERLRPLRQRRHADGPALGHDHGRPRREREGRQLPRVVPARPLGEHPGDRPRQDQRRVQRRPAARHRDDRAGLRRPDQPLSPGRLRGLPQHRQRDRIGADLLPRARARQEDRSRRQDRRLPAPERRGQALAYVRSRYYESFKDGKWQIDPTSDLGRIKRQQYFLRTLARRGAAHERARAVEGARHPRQDACEPSARSRSSGSRRCAPSRTRSTATRPMSRRTRCRRTPEYIDGQAALVLDDAEAAPILAHGCAARAAASAAAEIDMRPVLAAAHLPQGVARWPLRCPPRGVEASDTPRRESGGDRSGIRRSHHGGLFRAPRSRRRLRRHRRRARRPAREGRESRSSKPACPSCSRRGLAANRLSSSSAPPSPPATPTIVFLCVQTPQGDDGVGRPLVSSRTSPARSRRCSRPTPSS